MRNKLMLALALSSALVSGITYAGTGDEGHGLAIYGRLEKVESGCTVLMSKYVLNLNNDGRPLGEQGVARDSALANDHIYVQLGGKNCDVKEGYEKIGLKFLGTTDSIEGNTLANIDTGSSAAQGTAVQLSDMFNNIIKPNFDIAHFVSDTKNGNSASQFASLPVYFTLVKLKGQETSFGTVHTNLTVQIERL